MGVYVGGILVHWFTAFVAVISMTLATASGWTAGLGLKEERLLEACKSGDRSAVVRLLNQGADIGCRDKRYGGTPLHWAAFTGRKRLVKLLLDQGADVNALNSDGRTALILAVAKGHVSVIRVLLDRDADVGLRGKDGKTALDWAKKKGRREVSRLLEAVSTVSAVPGKPSRKTVRSPRGEAISERTARARDGRVTSRPVEAAVPQEAPVPAIPRPVAASTPPSRKASRSKARSLTIAAGRGQKQEVERLLNEGANVNERDRRQRTPLMYAARSGHPDILTLLLSKGADINARDRAGNSALMLASSKGHLEVVKILLEKGADITVRDKGLGRTPLMNASRRGHTDVVKLLLEHGADVNSRDKSGESVLMGACVKGNSELVRLLIDKGADVNARDRMGNTALIRGSAQDVPEVPRLLLAKGADVNARSGRDGRTALLAACKKGHVETLKALVKHGANVSDRYRLGGSRATAKHPLLIRVYPGGRTRGRMFLSSDRMTALMDASQRGHTEVVRFLLDNGADVNAKDSLGNTALMAAARNGDREIVSMLLAKGLTSTQRTGPVERLSPAQPPMIGPMW